MSSSTKPDIETSRCREEPDCESQSLKSTEASSQVEAARKTAQNGLLLACAELPWLSGLAHRVRLEVDDRINVAAVTESGRVLVNSSVFADLSLYDASYIMSHELLHLALDTFRRETHDDDHRSVNIAHDYIINDILTNELGRLPPLGGLHRPGASEFSLEQVIAESIDSATRKSQACWRVSAVSADSAAGSSSAPLNAMARAMRDAGLLTETVESPPQRDRPEQDVDMIHSRQEQEMFPASIEEDERMLKTIRMEAAKSQALRSLIEQAGKLAIGRQESGNETASIGLVRGYYCTPWETALQRWLETAVPGQRDYARPSRRSTNWTDVVLPGRNRKGWTLHLVLDTSGSMEDELGRALGAIVLFGESVGIDEVHILQCDVEVTVDEWVPLSGLQSYRIAGYGGSDMSPALDRLSRDPEVEAVVVVTDGCIEYPAAPPAYRVLWVLVSDFAYFSPAYGQVLKMRP